MIELRGHHQTLRQCPGQRRREHRRREGHDPRDRRRERRRQVDGHAHCLRLLHRGRRRDPGRRPAGADRISPHDAIALGIGMVHQHFMLVETMTVAENIVLGAEPGSRLQSRPGRSGRSACAVFPSEFGLAVDPRRHRGNALGRPAAAGGAAEGALPARRRLLILDEPTAVLTPQEIESFFAILRGNAQQGRRW